VATTQYEALKSFLEIHLANENADGSRAGAKEKLNKLTQVQFYELSTDVYDELTRRQMNSNEAPFLPVRDEFHPKRNQARQKLATLPTTRFKDLAVDIYYELERRHPELKDMRFPKPTPQYYQPNNKFNGNYQPAAPGQTTIIPKTGTVKQEKIDFQIQKPTSRPGADNNVESNPKPYVNGNHSNIPIPDSMPPEYGLSRAPRSRSQSTTSSVSDIGHHYMSMASVTSSSSKGTRDT
ncbi:19818_t:CDS:2, partial [Racocetra persica]